MASPKITDEDQDHDFEIIDHDEVAQHQQQHQQQQQNNKKGLWIGIDLGTSNCACAIWDSNRGRPKWMRFQHLANKQVNGKAGRIVPSAVQIKMNRKEDDGASKDFITATEALWKDICKWNPKLTLTQPQNNLLTMTVGQKAVASLQQRLLQKQDSSHHDSGDSKVITSMKRVLGLCGSTKLKDLDPEFRKSLPFTLEETDDGQWVVPCEFKSNKDEKTDDDDNDVSTIYLRPVHVAAMLLQAIREAVPLYLKKAIRKKKMRVPGYDPEATPLQVVHNVVVGVPAYFGQNQRHAVEEAARLAGYTGHVSTLTESTAAAMAYGLFVGGEGGGPANINKDDKSKPNRKAILVLDMGGGTTDITIAHMKTNNDTAAQADNATPDQKFQVILTDGESRLGGEDMDQALLEHVVQKASASSNNKGMSQLQLTAQQKQRLLQSCQQAKELLCGDVDHNEPPAKSATVQLPPELQFPKDRMELTKDDLEEAIEPLLEQTALLMERTLRRYADKILPKGKGNNADLIAEAILIGGATRVPALRQMLKERFFSNIELCTSVNAMSAVAQGTAIQAALLSRQVPLHELRSAMMLDTTPHAIGVMLSGDDGPGRFVEVLPRDSPLPAEGHATFYVADLDQKGVTVEAVELIDATLSQQQAKTDAGYQKLGYFTFLLHRLSETQRSEIMEDADRPGLRRVDIGFTLTEAGAFQVSIFDPNDPDHIRKKEFYQKEKEDANFEAGLLDYVQAAADLKSEGMTMEEIKLVVVAAILFVFYIAVKVLLSKEDILTEEDMARIL